MKESRRKLSQEINKMEKKLQKKEHDSAPHSLIELINEHKIAFLVFLFPTLLWGAKGGKMKMMGKIFKQLIKFGAWTAIDRIKARAFRGFRK